ncbi:magnesium transporter [Allorhizobium ampelinum]|uniref:Magnesium transport protein CorA n=3 Tax=Rhizobiaceae TaxID=82115 RepID=B9JSF6_ALLAM|nr:MULTISPECIES: magnesium transporter CorA family protein [Rhizobium/Agrobacterium group]ACM35649.1 magnesium/cobalt transport protein [Allorhizobium ampelinum S4]MBF2717062.1 magnesium transporter CorA family protein [Agrobacterium vitis]MCF1447861.1 magnesium transporter [Allorhizobium ampelinum]MCF1460344.1 magnesium transporter [Allorhizobium ampelinum]MCF1473185.1 magnesium transporter [Allorhizobium ampelinum]
MILPSDAPAVLDKDVLWLDLLNPDRTEEALAERLLGLPLPTRDDLKDIEPSSRLYMDDHGVYMTASLLCKAESDLPHLADVAFILGGGRLVTVRYAEPRAFGLFTAALSRNQAHCTSNAVMLARLLETVVDRTAEILEIAGMRVDALSGDVFVDRSRTKRRAARFLEDRLFDIASHHRLVSKTRDSLASLSRLSSFLLSVEPVKSNAQARDLCQVVAHDIQSLSEHAGFIASNISFMLDASLGLINVEQNSIIKIFSIASVVFLPPTLVASIYGMNFQVMPELTWLLGYPFALIVMVLSAIIPFLFFRSKGWL